MKFERFARRNCDPDQLTALIDGSEMRHRILPGGSLDVDVATLRLSHRSLQRGRYGMGILVDGAWPRDQIAIGFVFDGPSDASVNGFLCPKFSLQLYAEGSPLNYRAAPGTTWFAYCVARDEIENSVREMSGYSLALPASGSVSVALGPDEGRRVASTIQSLFAVASRAASELHDLNLDAIEKRLHHELAQALRRTTESRATEQHRLACQRRQLISKAEEFLSGGAPESFRVGELADAVGMSQRMLEHHFRRLFAVAPNAWYRAMMLNAVRNDLLAAGSGSDRIADIAMRRGFLHLGRFAQGYRQLFGERPSETLRRRAIARGEAFRDNAR